jgi:hypothetical protein
VTEGKHSNGSTLVKIGKGASALLIVFPAKNNLLATEMKCGKMNCDKNGGKGCMYINPLTPNDPYRGRTAPLTAKVSFYIFIQKI